MPNSERSILRDRQHPKRGKIVSKTILILGGSRYVVPIIEVAQEMGHRVVTCDYLPDNYAHSLSNEYRYASIVDKDEVLHVAREVRADGIMSFAADPGVVTAAYVAEQLNLPFQGSFETVKIMQNKKSFRAMLSENGFNSPRAFSFNNISSVMKKADAFPYPVIVKPTDSAGSKGVSRVDAAKDLRQAAETAFAFSASKTCIIEEYIEKAGCSSDSDGFTVDGRFECLSFTDQLFDECSGNPYAPMAYSMPSTMPESAQVKLNHDLQRLADLLGLRSGIYNIETRIGIDGEPYIMEMSPRGGGNRLAEMLRMSSQVDLISASVSAALDMHIENVAMPRYDGFWYQQMLYSRKNGTFVGIEIDPMLDPLCVRETQLWIEPGDKVHAFESANYAIGSAFFRFDTKAELEAFTKKSQPPITVTVA